MKHKIVTIIFLATLIGAFLIIDSLWVFLLLSLLIVLIYLFVLIAGVSIIKWNYFLPSQNHVETGKLALTFDDGPGPESKEVLNVLDKYHVKATFFLIGKKCEEHPELVKELHEKGHTIGNHSYSHTNNLGWASTKKLEEEINKTNTIIEELTGQKPVFYRPPFGVTNPNVAKAVKQTKMKSIGWSIRTYDTMAKSHDSLIKKVLPKINRSGHIVLMHDHCVHTAKLLEEVIQHCETKGIEIVNLEQ